MSRLTDGLNDTCASQRKTITRLTEENKRLEDELKTAKLSSINFAERSLSNWETIQVQRKRAEKAEAKAERLREAVLDYIHSRKVLVMAMKDGINVQGAVSGEAGYADMLEQALAQLDKEVEGG